ncbi:MAG: sigma-70 family RNA polymerase sigma factor [Okeania sp. SIO3B5]|nr:sigma-70 family RNA polymerase sigma factor [Okeania sp. SIO3B5]
MENAATENDRSHLISQFWQQWQESRGQLYRCCLKIMNSNQMDAEDALSQAMVKAWEKVQKFGEKITNLKAWLYQVTRNFCIDLIRKRSCGAVGVESIEWVGNTEEVITTGTVECPESVLEREERSDQIREAIAELPEKCRETFILHFYRELSHKEIAEQQGISYDNVCKRISLARKQLKERLSRYFRDSESESLSGRSLIAKSPHVPITPSQQEQELESQNLSTLNENGEKHQRMEEVDKNILAMKTVSMETDIANIREFPNGNAMLGCHGMTPSPNAPISLSKSEVAEVEELKNAGSLRGLNIRNLVNVSLRMSVWWQGLMQEMECKGGGGAIALRLEQCMRGLFGFFRELTYLEITDDNSSSASEFLHGTSVFASFNTG